MKLLKAMTMQERFGKLLDVKLICILALVVFFMSGSAYAQEPIRGTGQFIEVDSHADKYLVGQSDGRSIFIIYCTNIGNHDVFCFIPIRTRSNRKCLDFCCN